MLNALQKQKWMLQEAQRSYHLKKIKSTNKIKEALTNWMTQWVMK